MKKYVGVFILAFLSLFVVNSFAQTTPPSGTGLSFNGTNQYVRIPSADAFNIAANESFTVSCWVKVPAWPSAMGPRILSKRNIQRGFDEAGQNASYELWTGNASSPNHYFANNVVSATASTNIMSNWIGLPASTATWYHLCMVIDKTANDINLYQNGVMSDNHKASPATTLAGWVVNNRFDLLIGCDRDYSNNTSSHFFNGEIADVRFYKKALTAAEVTTDMTATVTGATAGLVAAYDFKNMSGATVPDIKGTNPGTLMNFAPQGDVVAAPTFSPAAGHYTDAQNVTLASTEAGAKIYYTVDGSTPTTASTEYTAAIVVSENTTIKAIAAKAGMVTSAVVSAAYTIGAILPDYCKYDGNRADMRNRLINSINVTGATVDGASQTFSFDNAITYQSPVYSDKTANVLNATQGDE
ncbi:MAG: LamG-like jellyroll fold domain-containing protein, partial [Bacteroidaceae bacterium]